MQNNPKPGFENNTLYQMLIMSKSNRKPTF